jgi:hypothetical protein
MNIPQTRHNFPEHRQNIRQKMVVPTHSENTLRANPESKNHAIGMIANRPHQQHRAGNPAAGKSRVANEALRRLSPRHGLYRFEQKSDSAEIAEFGAPPLLTAGAGRIEQCRQPVNIDEPRRNPTAALRSRRLQDLSPRFVFEHGASTPLQA